MELKIPEIDVLLSTLEVIKNKIEEKETNINQEWYNDEQCWKLKGGMALSTYRTKRFYQIKGGIPDGYVGGRKVWSKKSVIEWLPLTDDELIEYHQRYNTGAQK